jgi:hypothetical protein
MFETGERAGVEERYSVAGNTSDMSVEADKRNSADVIIAAGWSPSRLGMALLRLHSEWSGLAKPHKPTKKGIDAMAETIKGEDAQADANRAKSNGELARLQALQAKEPDFDRAVEIMELERLYDKGALPLPSVKHGSVMDRANLRAQSWYSNELRLLANGLKARAVVWEQLGAWADKQGMAGDVAAEALLFWLDSTCPACDGLKMKRHVDAPMLSSRACPKCHGSGQRASPLGSGRLLVYLDYCVSVARGSLKKRLRPE